MNKVIAIASLLTLVAGLTVSTSAAEARRYGVNHRQFRQQRRIDGGIANGQLTRKETRGLERKEQRLAKQEQRMRASGDGLSRKERSRLEHEQNVLSKDIYHQKHDNQAR